MLLNTLHRCVLLVTFKKFVAQPYSGTPYSVLHTDCPSSVEYDILSRARLLFMLDDMGDHNVIFALPPGPRARIARRRCQSSVLPVDSYVKHQRVRSKHAELQSAFTVCNSALSRCHLSATYRIFHRMPAFCFTRLHVAIHLN